MNELLIGMGSGLWLGLLTSVSPCPLATNVVAVSYVSKRLSSPRQVLWRGILYTLGRMTAYVLLGLVLVSSLLSIPEVAVFLQDHMNRLLGPLLIVVGLILLEWIRLRLLRPGVGHRMQRVADSAGMGGGFLLGVVFALSFCPLSAALFFGSLIPLSLQQESRILLPSVYGIGTGLPVLLFSVLLAWGAHGVGKVFQRLTELEIWARRVTGMIFLLGGLYYTLIYWFDVPLWI